MSTEREFTFNASALGVGGVVEQRRPDGTTRKIVVPSLASVALAPTGGDGTAVMTNYESEVVSFTRAETRVAGGRLGDSSLYSTFTDVFITNLRVLDRLSVALLHATVTSTRDTDLEDDDHSSFTLHAVYRGVEYDGEEIAPVVDVELCDRRSYQSVKDLLNPVLTSQRETHDAGQKALLERFNAIDEPSRTKLKERIDGNKAIHGSIVKEIQRGQSFQHATSHLIHLPGLGTARFGELMFKPGRRRINLLRLTFGRNEAAARLQRMEPESTPQPQFMMLESTGTYSGQMTVGSGEGNGSPPYP